MCAAAVHGLLFLRRTPAAAVRRRPAYRQPVRPSGGAAAPSGVHKQRSLQRELQPDHRPAHARHRGHLCAGGGGDGGRAHRQGGLWRLRQLPLQPRCRGLRRGGGIVAGAGGALPAALHAAATVECLCRAGKQHHRGYPAQRRHPEPEHPRRCAGRVRRPHGHRRSAGHSGLRPCAVDPEGRAHRRIGKFSHHLRAHRLFLPASGGSGRQHPLQQPAAPFAGHPGRAAHRCGAVLRGVPAQRALHLRPPPARAHPVRRTGRHCHHGLPLFRRVRDRRLLCVAGGQQRVCAH